MDNVKCLNTWDPQGGQAHGVCYAIDQQGGKSNCGYAEEVMMTLCSDSHGTPHALCYAIEGNVVDRASKKNGKGWCENVSPTLNTQDHHAICFQLCGDRDNPSVSVSDNAYCIPANPMSDRGQAVCIALEGNGARPSHLGKGFSDDETMYTLNTIEQHSVCYENHKDLSDDFKIQDTDGEMNEDICSDYSSLY